MINSEWDTRVEKKRLIDDLAEKTSRLNVDEQGKLVKPKKSNSDEDPEKDSKTPILPETLKNNKNRDKSSENRSRIELAKRIFALFILIGLISVSAFLIYRILQTNRSDYQYIGPLPYSQSYELEKDLDIPESLCSKSTDNQIDINIDADSYFAVYVDNFQVVAEKNIDNKVAFASIAKLLGAMVALDYYDLDQEIGLLKQVDTEGSGMELQVNEKMKVRDLLAASLIGSKNDAMWSLAQNYPGGQDEFVRAMQQKAYTIGMQNTSIQNPVGLDHEEQYSTAQDLAILSVAAMQRPLIADFVKQRSVVVTTSLNRQEKIDSTNGLLGVVDGVIGLKTGYTEKAGLCLITYVDSDKDFITIVLGSDDRVSDSENLIRWVQNNYSCK